MSSHQQQPMNLNADTLIYAPDADAMKANRHLPHHVRCNFMSKESGERAIAMAKASKRPNRRAELREADEAALAQAIAESLKEVKPKATRRAIKK